MSRSVAYSHFLIFGLELDLHKIVGIPGASFTINGVNAAGSDLSSRNIGNVFTVAQTFVGQGTYLYDVYWQQKLVEDTVNIRLGRINSSNFSALPAFGMQVSGGINGNPTSLFLDTSFLSTPDTVWGADIRITPTTEYYAYTGVYQATNLPGNQHGTDFSFRGSDRALVMLETGWTPTFGKSDKPGEESAGLSGIYAVGAYYSSLPVARFDGTGTVSETYGFYVMAQQTVWQNKDNSNESIALWGGATYAPQVEVAQMEVMGFGGFIWQGIIPGRDQDQLLGTVLVGTFGSGYADSVATPDSGRPTYEMALDFSYVININSNLFIQPDIQYIIRPGGMKNIQDALVIGMQFGVSF